MAWAEAYITYAPRLLPTHQAAVYLGVSPTKVLNLPIRPKQLDGKWPTIGSIFAPPLMLMLPSSGPKRRRCR